MAFVYEFSKRKMPGSWPIMARIIIDLSSSQERASYGTCMQDKSLMEIEMCKNLMFVSCNHLLKLRECIPTRMAKLTTHMCPCTDIFIK
jgi:hypothetical protein